MQLIDGFWFPGTDEHFSSLDRPIEDYQREQSDFATGLCRHHPHAVDVGAHVGIFTRRLSEEFAKVTAYEPVASVYACLRRNVDADVVTVNAAVADSPGTRVMHDLPCGWSFFADDPTIAVSPPPGMPRVEVDVRRIDDEDLGPVDLIKIDVQGAEPAVLRGATGTILEWRPVLIVEEKPLGKTDFSAICTARRLLLAMGARPVKRIGADVAWAFDVS